MRRGREALLPELLTDPPPCGRDGRIDRGAMDISIEAPIFFRLRRAGSQRQPEEGK
jgi:hypothetical protein